MADIVVEKYVSEHRQQELIRCAEIGAPATAIRNAIREAVQAERERCAKVAMIAIVDGGNPLISTTANLIAEAIRNGDA